MKGSLQLLGAAPGQDRHLSEIRTLISAADYDGLWLVTPLSWLHHITIQCSFLSWLVVRFFGVLYVLYVLLHFKILSLRSPSCLLVGKFPRSLKQELAESFQNHLLSVAAPRCRAACGSHGAELLIMLRKSLDQAVPGG